jgi:hypothetical protein
MYPILFSQKRLLELLKSILRSKQLLTTKKDIYYGQISDGTIIFA